MSVKDTVIDIIVEQLGAEKKDVDPSKSLVGDLNADSLDLMEINMRLEENFKCEIPDEEAEKLKTVGDIIQYVENRLASEG